MPVLATGSTFASPAASETYLTQDLTATPNHPDMKTAKDILAPQLISICRNNPHEDEPEPE